MTSASASASAASNLNFVDILLLIVGGSQERHRLVPRNRLHLNVDEGLKGPEASKWLPSTIPLVNSKKAALKNHEAFDFSDEYHERMMQRNPLSAGVMR